MFSCFYSFSSFRKTGGGSFGTCEELGRVKLVGIIECLIKNLFEFLIHSFHLLILEFFRIDLLMLVFQISFLDYRTGPGLEEHERGSNSSFASDTNFLLWRNFGTLIILWVKTEQTTAAKEDGAVICFKWNILHLVWIFEIVLVLKFRPFFKFCLSFNGLLNFAAF